ncbi:expressed protein [Phakopsora pachyrhizi]|uniref:Expressed protein n=1 Tax=Phakopsora pachyrhizi TaxID=170000 RepID=A0AAV0BKU0_PHAPC|nr:expressed protein [Phakopsora pachyrhizi]
MDPTRADEEFRHTVRPSMVDLSKEDFYNEIESEAKKLNDRQKNCYTQDFSNSFPPVVQQEAYCSSFKKPETKKKKSRFAQKREAEILRVEEEDFQTNNGHDKCFSFPTGRFELNLDDGLETLPKSSMEKNSKSVLIGEIVERDQVLEESLDEDFTSRYQPMGFPKAVKESLSQHPEIDSELIKVEKNTSLVLSGINQTFNSSVNSATPENFISPQLRDQISHENDAILAKMDEREILREQAALRHLLEQSNPKLLQSLMGKSRNIATQVEPEKPKTSTVGLLSSVEITKQVRYSDSVEVFSEKPTSSELLSDRTYESSASASFEQATFDITGQRVHEDKDSEGKPLSNNHENSDSDIHNHQLNRFTLKQLLRFTRSAVPSQRVAGFKIFTRIIQRHFDLPNQTSHTLEDPNFEKQINDSVPDIMISASHAIRDRNLGVVNSSLVLLRSVLFNSQIKRKSDLLSTQSAFKSEWIESLITQSSILMGFLSHFENQTLTRSTLIIIVQILQGFVELGDSTKVSEEIVKLSNFLEIIIQVLVSVSWPPVGPQKDFELPDSNSLKLLESLSKSSRSCSRSIIQRGLLTPTLRFVGLPYWNFLAEHDCHQKSESDKALLDANRVVSMIEFMCIQFRVIKIFAGYGLGTSLRTTLDPLLRSTMLGLRKRLKICVQELHKTASALLSHELHLITAYLELLKAWSLCADDPHATDPPHSITWSQVMDWNSEIFDLLEISLVSKPTTAHHLLNDIIASCCDLIGLSLTCSHRKKISNEDSLLRLKESIPNLQITLETATETLFSTSKNSLLLTEQNYGQSRLMISLAMLSLNISESQNKSDRAFLIKFSSESFSLACRIAFKYNQLSMLPWALCVLEGDFKLNLRRIIISSLLSRNSDGAMVQLMVEKLLEASQDRVNNLMSDLSDGEIKCEIDLKCLKHIYEDYLFQCGTLTSILNPSSQQIRDQTSQIERPAFSLSPTWPLLAINFLTQTHLTKSALNLTQLSRAVLSMIIIFQEELSEENDQSAELLEIFYQLGFDRFSIWKSVVTSLINVHDLRSKLRAKSSTQEDNFSDSIFEDINTCKLILKLLSTFQFKQFQTSNRQRLLICGPKMKDWNDDEKIGGEEGEEAYMALSNLLEIFDLIAPLEESSKAIVQNSLFAILLSPIFLMKGFSKDIIILVFKDSTQVGLKLKLIELFKKHSLSEILILVKCGDNIDEGLEEKEADFGLKSYFYPIEEDKLLLEIYFKTLKELKEKSRDLYSGGGNYEFLHIYFLHHISSYIWNIKLGSSSKSNKDQETYFIKKIIEKISTRDDNDDDEMKAILDEVLNYDYTQLIDQIRSRHLDEQKDGTESLKLKKTWFEFKLNKVELENRLKLAKEYRFNKTY